MASMNSNGTGDMCECGHSRYDHSARGCGYMHRDAGGNFSVQCNRFRETDGNGKDQAS